MTPTDEPRGRGGATGRGTVDAVGLMAPRAERRMPAVCVIVLNWNGEADTAACLDSILAQQGVSSEILLVDNGSPDESGARLHARYPEVSYVQTGENLGYAGGNNRGIEWALARGAEWLLVVNNDTVLDPTCLRRLLDAAATDDGIGALAPLIVRYDDEERVWFAGGRHDRTRAVGVHEGFNDRVRHVLARLPHDAPVHWCTFLTGCCLLLRASAIAEVGAFRADFFSYVEDLELSVRLRAAGWRIGWVPAARLAHRVPPMGAEPTPLQIRLRDRNRRRLVRRAYRLPWRLAFSLWFWPTRLILYVRYALRRDWLRAGAIGAGMAER